MTIHFEGILTGIGTYWVRLPLTPNKPTFFPSLSPSVTRLGDLLHFGQLFQACGSTYFGQIAHIFGNFCKGVKIFHFSNGFILGNFYRHLATFYWSHCSHPLYLGICTTHTTNDIQVGIILKQTLSLFLFQSISTYHKYSKAHTLHSQSLFQSCSYIASPLLIW